MEVPRTWFKGCLPYSVGGPLIYPVGRWRTWVDLYAFRQLERLRLIEQVYGGIQGIGDSKEFPFREDIERLYLERDKDEQKKWAIKIVLNSMYGKFAETIEERFTSHTNFFTVAEITARTRWRLFQDINPDDVIFYATDGVFLRRKPEGLDFGTHLGQWSEAEEIRDASQTALRPVRDPNILTYWKTICFITRVINGISLKEAITEFVHDRDSIALEGFSHLIPFAAGHEIIRQQRRNLTLIRLTPDIIYDQMIGMGCAQKLVFSWAGNPGVGLLHRFREAVEKGWPSPLVLEEHTHGSLAAAYVAGAARLPFGTMRGYPDTDLLKHASTVSAVECPFTGEKLAAVRAINPDVAIIHAQRADRQGNVQLWGILGVQKEAVYAASRVIVTVEEICEKFEPVVNGMVIPSWIVSATVVVPGGARPSYTHGYYRRDNAFYQEWDSIARDRGRFMGWMEQNVLEYVPA